MKKLFGTDGIRGTANSEPMTPDTAMQVAMAAARYFRQGDHRHRVVIGKDTRLSCYMIETAMIAGFTSMGMDVFLLGPVPTPAVGMLTRSLRADCGVMISASHNLFADNGIKFFGRDGFKLSDEVEARVEHYMEELPHARRAQAHMIGHVQRLEDARARYIEFAKATFPRHLSLDHIKIVVDCANGAAYRTAPEILWELGADVHSIGISPSGTNINDKCGSNAPQLLQKTVLKHGADIGIALDGDADRVIMVDENGKVIDGDQIMALIASEWNSQKLLRGDGVVATQMSNMGLEIFLRSQGMHLERTRVGDRYVVEKMRNSGYNLGGEQSGHIILTDYTTTGDGLIASLQLLAALVRSGKTASQLCHLFDPYPQFIRNIALTGNSETDPLAHEQVQKAIRQGDKRLGDGGRLFVRKSGTEPLIRVMVESEDQNLAQTVVGEVGDSIERVTNCAESA